MYLGALAGKVVLVAAGVAALHAGLGAVLQVVAGLVAVVARDLGHVQLLGAVTLDVASCVKKAKGKRRIVLAG